ncbi:MAG: response regulator [Devosia sp.]
MTTVIVVEDDAIVRLVTVTFLEDAGYQVLEASDAHEAIALLEERDDVRVVVTDVDMPGTMDGIRLAHYVRDRWPPIHIVVVSGLPNSAGLPSGAIFIPKPFTSEALLARLARLTG